LPPISAYRQVLPRRPSGFTGDGYETLTVATPQPTSMLVVDATEVRVGTVKRWIRQNDWARPLFATDMATATEIAAGQQPEVALVDLLFSGGCGVALAIELRRLSAAMEVVLIVDDPGAPEVQVAFDAGCARVVRSDGLGAWLDRGLLALGQLVRAERRAALARAEAEELAAGNVPPAPSALPLAVAERRYREAYLRAKLAQACGRREAAALAGIPYTTFCVMLRKLGIQP